MKKLIILTLPLLLCRCSTIPKSIGLGACIGAASGFTASRFAEYNTKGSVVLTASGALIGGALAALLHKDLPTDLSQAPGGLLNERPPSLKNAETDVIWVPDSVQDEKYIEGHRVFIIQNPAHWQLYPAIEDEEEKRGKDHGNNRKEKQEKRATDSSGRRYQEASKRVEE